jgi:outer membrane protein OmpA-like peptidoglycan-associated protein
MAEDWALNVKKYEADADDGVIAGIVRYCGIALQKRDSSLVSFGDPVETGRVRENYLKKKLGLTHSDADLDTAIAKVGERMKGENFKNRVTVYYLLAQHFNLLHTFGKGGAAKAETTATAPVEAPAPAVETSSALPLAAAGVGAAVAGAASTATSAATSAVGTAGAVAAGALGGAAAIAGSVGGSVSGAASSATSALTGGFSDDDDGKSGMGWLPWLLLALGVLAALWYFFMRKPVEAPAPMPAATETAAPAAVETTPAAAPAEGTVAIPAGAGVTSETRDGKPVVKVYFDTSKTNVVEAFNPAAAGLKSYLDTHAGSSLAVTGFADKRGNAAANAALSKGRAENVKAALISSGIAEASIELVKPSDAVDNTDDLAGARRVEVLVR